MTNIPSRLIETDHCEIESMILEVAVIEVKPGFGEQFESGVVKALPVFNRAKGYTSLRLERSIETPHRYRLVIAWETLETMSQASEVRRTFRYGDHLSGIRSPSHRPLSTLLSF